MSRTLLVIDDNPLVRDVVRLMLESRGYDVLVAEDGEAGRALMSRRPVDAAIVDVDMPKMNGVDVCRALCSDAARAGHGIWVWLMTGVTRSDLAARALAAGAKGILPKPFTTQELVQCIEREFERGEAA